MQPAILNILLVDNHDSFTYNIAHIIRKHAGTNLQIIEADKIDIGKAGNFDKIIFSPGPDIPEPGNIMEKILDKWAGIKSILGICLGMQAIWIYYGGKLKQLEKVAHGRKYRVFLNGNPSGIFTSLPAEFEAGFYHSWIVDPSTTPASLIVTATSDYNRIMAIRHRSSDIEAVQFHPESIMTPLGEQMIANWLNIRT